MGYFLIIGNPVLANAYRSFPKNTIYGMLIVYVKNNNFQAVRKKETQKQCKRVWEYVRARAGKNHVLDRAL